MSYPRNKLGDYIEVLSGFAFKSKDFSDSGVPVIKIKNISPPVVTLEDVSYVPESIAFQNARYILKKGDVLIALTGSHINQIASVVGRVGRVRYDETSVLNQRVGKIINKDDRVSNLDFIYYYLSQFDVKVELAQKAGGAANQANISPSDIKDLHFPCPPIDIQNKIAEVLSRYDALIENYQRQIKLLEEAAQRLYKEWFVDLRFPGHQSTPIINNLPQGWEIQSITNSDYFNFAKCRITPFYGVKSYYATADVENTYFANKGTLIEYENKPSRAQIQPSKHSVWFARMSKTYKIIGFSESNERRRKNAILSSGFAGFECEPSIFAYLYCLISSEWFNSQKDIFATGATQVSITNEGLSMIKFKCPERKLVLAFSEKVNNMIEEIFSLRENCVLLSEARDRLLPKLMSAEIEV